jgi:hypothetical protein
MDSEAWELPEYSLKQLAGIGEATRAKLCASGLSTVEVSFNAQSSHNRGGSDTVLQELRAATTVEIEAACGRRPPFGKSIKDEAEVCLEICAPFLR